MPVPLLVDARRDGRSWLLQSDRKLALTLESLRLELDRSNGQLSRAWGLVIPMVDASLSYGRADHEDTVDMIPNYDGTTEEPIVLPARFPNLLANGSTGIAVGMATNIPPHNLGEVIDAVVHLIDHPGATPDELMEFVKGPDFPTGGTIYGMQGVRDAYETGRGRVIIRGNTRIEEMAGGRQALIIDELPYLVGTSPELPSVLQSWVDHEAREAGLLVAVAGSSQRMMQGLVLSADAPLFGRADEVLELALVGKPKSTPLTFSKRAMGTEAKAKNRKAED